MPDGMDRVLVAKTDGRYREEQKIGAWGYKIYLVLVGGQKLVQKIVLLHKK